jgi:hypothetical protein
LAELDETPGQYIIMNLRHFAPPVVYLDSPLSFMVPGGARLFYQGEGEEFDDSLCEDPSVLTYFVIQTVNYTDECKNNKCNKD